jgi:hypothetical protein
MENYQGNGRQIDFLSVLSALVVNRIKNSSFDSGQGSNFHSRLDSGQLKEQNKAIIKQ